MGITLLSDFGLQDASVAVAKGILMQHAPQLPILDISHEVTPFHLRQAAYLLAAAYKHFPPRTCHLILFDVFSHKAPGLVLTEYHDQYFLSADNGILPLALGDTINSWRYFEMKAHHTYIDWLNEAAAAINLLQSKKPASLGLPLITLKSLPIDAPLLSPAGFVECEVIHIDQYGNVILNITKRQFEALSNNRPFRIQFKSVEDIDTVSSSYADVREGYKLSRFNSNGHLEICINRGNAASLFGLRLEGKHNDIKIYFE